MVHAQPDRADGHRRHARLFGNQPTGFHRFTALILPWLSGDFVLVAHEAAHIDTAV